jgi:hypothetical protein
VDKARYVQIAPAYYALAIAHFLGRNYARPASESDIVNFYTVRDDDDPDGNSFLCHRSLLAAGLRFLVENSLMDTIKDDFGPTLYRQSSLYDNRLRELKKDERLPFYKLGLIDEPLSWIYAALASVNSNYELLDISTEDFKNPPDADADWAPIPLDRDDTNLKGAIAAIDETIEQVRADNGYNANVPEERAYVLDSLSTLSKRLKEAATVSYPYIERYGIEPLKLLIRRFSGAAIGIAAEASRDAVVTWLKNLGLKFLESFWK